MIINYRHQEFFRGYSEISRLCRIENAKKKKTVLYSTKMKEASCLALFSITYNEERAVNCLKNDFFFSLAEGNWKRRANWKYNLLRIKGPQKFIRSNRPRNFYGSLSQKFLPMSRCLRNFCGWVVVKEISVAHGNCIFWVAFLLMFSRLLRPQ